MGIKGRSAVWAGEGKSAFVFRCLEMTAGRLLPLLAALSWLAGAWLVSQGQALPGILLGCLISMASVGDGLLWTRRKNRYAALAGLILMVQIWGTAAFWISMQECQQGRYPLWLLPAVLLLQGALVLPWQATLPLYGLTAGWCGIVSVAAGRPAFFIGCAAAGALAMLFSWDTYRRFRENHQRNRMLLQISHRDELTGLYNRRGMNRRLEELWDRSRCERRSLGIVMVDIDDFKAFNDIHGHLQGDRCLRALADIILNLPHGEEWFAARYGGEEFLLVMIQEREEDGADQARELAKRLRNPERSGEAFGVTVSAGVYAGVPQKGDALEKWLEKADQAMYQAKSAGKNRIIDLSLRIYRPEAFTGIGPHI